MEPSKTKAFINQIVGIDSFILQPIAAMNDLCQLNDTMEAFDSQLGVLKEVKVNTHCIVRSPADDKLYRALVLERNSESTTVLCIDNGNTEIITDPKLIKATTEALTLMPAIAIPCSLPLEVKDGIEWSREAYELLQNFASSGEVEFQYVCEGVGNNFVKLYRGERDIVNELTQNGYAVEIAPLQSGSLGYVHHINSMSDFWLHMTSDTEALRKVSESLLDDTKLKILTDIKDGMLCAAKRSKDNRWYRGKVMSNIAGVTEVFFIDVGVTSLSTELRAIPTEIANVPSLAKHCSMRRPQDIKYWCEHAEQRFVDMTYGKKIFSCNVVSPGKIYVVDLLVDDGQSILDEIGILHRNMEAAGMADRFEGLIAEGTPPRMYVQMQSDVGEWKKMNELLDTAATWPVLEEKIAGQMCAALCDGAYYRAEIVSLTENGALVFYVDYGNQAGSTDLRILHPSLNELRYLAVCCSLASKDGIYSQDLIERFDDLPKGKVVYDFKYVNKNCSPPTVQLFVKGRMFAEKPIEK